MIVVSDSTILIGLVKIGELDLLKEIFSKVYIPEEVFKEVVERGKGKPSRTRRARALSRQEATPSQGGQRAGVGR